MGGNSQTDYIMNKFRIVSSGLTGQSRIVKVLKYLISAGCDLCVIRHIPGE